MDVKKYFKITYLLKTWTVFLNIYSVVLGYLFYRDTKPMFILLSFIVGCAVAFVFYLAMYKNRDYEPGNMQMNFLLFAFLFAGMIFALTSDNKFAPRFFNFYISLTIISFLVNLYYAYYVEDRIRNNNIKNESFSVETNASKRQFFTYLILLSVILLIVCCIPFFSLSKLLKPVGNYNSNNSNNTIKTEKVDFEEVSEPEEVVEEDIDEQIYHGIDTTVIKVILITILVFAITVILFFVIRAIIAKLESINRHKHTYEDAPETEGVIVSNKDLVKDDKKDKLSGFFLRDPRKQVRLSFVKAVKYRRKKDIKKSLVPKELILEEEKTAAEAELRALYEKAKYSENEITKADAAKARECYALIKKTY